MTDARAIRYVGQSLRRREDFKLITGKGRYVDDIKLPGMLHMAVLRSPHAHAVINSIDLTEAAAAPGVRLVLSGKDLVGKIGSIIPNWIIPGTKVPVRPVVAVDRVRFVGECVALVVAESQTMAHDAVGLINVDYETLPAVVDEEAATAMARRSCTTTCPTTSRPCSRSGVAIISRPRGRPTRSFGCASSITG
jgi:aerobic carbon-monoxide dehydrogenase large subunit